MYVSHLHFEDCCLWRITSVLCCLLLQAFLFEFQCGCLMTLSSKLLHSNLPPNGQFVSSSVVPVAFWAQRHHKWASRASTIIFQSTFSLISLCSHNELSQTLMPYRWSDHPSFWHGPPASRLYQISDLLKPSFSWLHLFPSTTVLSTLVASSSPITWVLFDIWHYVLVLCMLPIASESSNAS